MRARMLPTAVVLMITLGGCASAITATSARNHAIAADAASKAGDWRTAREQWAKALVNAQLAGAPASQLAMFNYEYGRALGVQCFWGKAETHLLKAHELDSATAGPDYMAATELSRLKLAQKEYPKAADYYSRAILALEKLDAPSKAPTAFADVLDEYSSALRNLGKIAEAETIAKRATEIRRSHPGGQSLTDRTPYGSQCAPEAGP